MSTSIALAWRRAWNGNVDCAFAGDNHLAAVLRLHREVERVGVLRAVRSSSAEELATAKLGYEYFGLSEVVPTIEKAQRVLKVGQDLRRFDRGLAAEYGDLLLDDKLFRSFTICYRLHPSDFAAVP